MVQQILSTNTFTTAKWIVSATSSDGTHTTIASALTSSASGDTIFIRPGTYTENLTLKAGVNLTAFVCDATTPNVTISGKCTFNAAGTVSISGINLQTNSDFALAVTGSVASIVNLSECNLNCLNNTGISFTSSSASAQVNVFKCRGNLATTGIGLFAHSSAGNMIIDYCDFTNTGASSTASTVSAGIVYIAVTGAPFPFSTSSGGIIAFSYSSVNTSATNTTCFTTAGTGTSVTDYTDFISGTASALSIGTGTTLTVLNCARVDSTNTNAITGAGTLKYGLITFTNTSSTVNTTTNTPLNSVIPAFLAVKSANTTNATGDGTTATVICDTEVFDLTSNYNNSTGVFTAPATGKYHFDLGVSTGAIGVQTLGGIELVTTARTYFGNFVNPTAVKTSANTIIANFAVLANMTSGDTASMAVVYTGSTKTVSIVGDGTGETFFSGNFVC